MIDKELEELKQLFELLETLKKEEEEKVSRYIKKVIASNIKDENIISHIFDRILDLSFIDYDNTEILFYELLNYVNKFNKDLGDDYKKLFIEQFEIEDSSNNKQKKIT